VPFHWGDEHGDRTAANYLTIPATGRVAKQPELKYCAVRLLPIDPPAARHARGLDPESYRSLHA
jgi:ferredoxin-nitrate reductase